MKRDVYLTVFLFQVENVESHLNDNEEGFLFLSFFTPTTMNE